MLDQKVFGEKLRNHRKNLGMTQEEVAERVGVSPQAVSKWEAGDCLPDCFNLKAISDLYKISADVLLETESGCDIESVANKIEQLGTEFVWAKSKSGFANHHEELGEDLWKMWKGLYFAEPCEQRIQDEGKRQGNLRVTGSFGTKIWDDDGIACVIKSSLIKNLKPADPAVVEVINALCSEEGQKLIISLSCGRPTPKQEIIEKTNIELARLNELLILFTENRIIEFVDDDCSGQAGYVIGGQCGIVPYMVLAAMYVLDKKSHAAWLYMFKDSDDGSRLTASICNRS